MVVTHGGDLFAVAREHGWDWHEVLDFSANINPLGPSPKVNPAICRALDRIVHYPEREPVRLLQVLAQEWGLEQNQILLGNGATELLFFFARLFSSIDVTLALPVFLEFPRAFQNFRTADLYDSRTWPREGLLVITRPANPTGWTVSLETICSYLKTCAAWVLVDESFLEFSGFSSAATLISGNPRLIILRSLTKFYALPGLRVGALVGSALTVRLWKEHREPWQVNVLAEEAALAAIGDTAHAARSVEFVRSERDWLADRLRSLPKSEPLPTDTNFLFVRLGYPAEALCEHLLLSKILVRNCAGWAGVNGPAVRVAVRTREENERLLEAWRNYRCQ